MINVLSKSQMKAWVRSADPDDVRLERVISIIDPGEDRIFDDGAENKLTLFFDDIEREHPDYRGRRPLVLFGKEQADKVIQFLSEQPCVPLNIHCTAGISRSGAIAQFACEYLLWDDREMRKRNPWIIPNCHVLNTLRRVYRGLPLPT